MEPDQKRLINIDAVCILKSQPKTNLVMVDYVPFERSLDNNFEKLKEMAESEYHDASSMLSLVENHYKLSVLLSKFDFCSFLCSGIVLPY